MENKQVDFDSNPKIQFSADEITITLSLPDKIFTTMMENRWDLTVYYEEISVALERALKGIAS